MDNRLDIDGLSVEFPASGGSAEIVRAVRLRIGPGEIVCLIGESGSGKTVTALSILRLIDYQGGRINGGTIAFDGRDLAQLSRREMTGLRGRRIGIIFQEPMTAFDPLFSIGEQIAEVIVRHLGVSRARARREAVAVLQRVKMPDAALRADQYPHELSGGMLQRAMIAMALACQPTLLIADEPTTALDVTIQAQILDLLKDIRAETGLSILLITHDLGVAADIADRVAVMYAGRVVESGAAAEILQRPAHPYTRGLLRSVVGHALGPDQRLYSIPGAVPDPTQRPNGCSFHPRCSHATQQCRIASPPLARLDTTEVACWNPYRDATIPERIHDIASGSAIATAQAPPTPLFDVHDLHKHYRLGHGWHAPLVKALDGVSFQIHAGETFGLVGESGSGKSTLARVLLHLERPDSGRIVFDDKDLSRVNNSELRRLRRDMQIVFQDPNGSVDPRWTIGRIIGEPLTVHAHLTPGERAARISLLLDQVGIEPSWHDRYPHQLSGGQRQRVAIARAIALHPKFVLADEAVSALDVSVQAQIINLLQELKERLGLTYLFIGHGLNVVRHISDRIGVMYLGRLVETGPTAAIFDRPAHPYTRELIAAIPSLDPARRRGPVRLRHDTPPSGHTTLGCRFQQRCAAAAARCREEEPPLAAIDAQRSVACHFPL